MENDFDMDPVLTRQILFGIHTGERTYGYFDSGEEEEDQAMTAEERHLSYFVEKNFVEYDHHNNIITSLSEKGFNLLGDFDSNKDSLWITADDANSNAFMKYMTYVENRIATASEAGEFMIKLDDDIWKYPYMEPTRQRIVSHVAENGYNAEHDTDRSILVISWGHIANDTSENADALFSMIDLDDVELVDSTKNSIDSIDGNKE